MVPPSLSWPFTDRNSFYTLMAVDAGLGAGAFFFHYLVSNVPGSDVDGGDVVFDWIPPFR